MKKLLLSLLCLGAMSLSASAETIALVATGTTYSGSADSEQTFEKLPISVTGVCSIAFSDALFSSGIRWYANSSMTVSPESGVTISKITWKDTYTKSPSYSVSDQNGTVSASNKEFTWSGNSTTDIIINATAQARFTYLEITYVSNDNRQDVTISWSSETAVANLGESFTAPVLTITPEAAKSEVIYGSSNENVATIDNNGFVKVLAAGTTEISASINGSEIYKNASVSYKLTVSDPNMMIDELTATAFNISGSTYQNYSYTSPITGIVYKANANLNNGIQINSATTGINVQENKNGYILTGIEIEWITSTAKERGFGIKGNDTPYTSFGAYSSLPGTEIDATSVTSKGTQNYSKRDITGNYTSFAIATNPAGAIALVNVKLYYTKGGDPSKADAGLKYDTTSYELTFGDAFTAPDLVNPNGLTVTYESNKPEVVEVDANTGAVTIKAPGVATITAKSEETDKFNAGSASYTLDIAAVASSIAQFETFGKNDSNLEIQVNFPMTVGFVNNQNVFVTDGEKWIQIYAPNSYNANDVIPAGWIGTYTLYRDYTPEIVPVGTLPVATETAELTFRNVSTISNADVNEVVVLENAVLSEASPAAKDDVPVTVNGEAVSVYNNYSVASVEAGTYNITGVVNIFQGSPVLYVIKFDAVPEAPVMKVDDVEMSDFTGMQEINEDALISFEAANGETIWYRLSKVEATVNALAENADGFTLYENPFKVGDNNTLEFYAESAAGVKSEIKTLKFSVITGIEGVEVDAVNGVVEYFNLQGVKVEAPANGLYIRRQGAKVEKVIVK